MARYVLVDPVINSSNDKQQDYSITGRGVIYRIFLSNASPSASHNKKWAAV